MIGTFSSYLSDSGDIGSGYLSQASDQVERQYPEASHDAKCQAAASLAVAMAISHLATVASGSAEGSPFAEILKLLIEREERSSN